jgi:hypothetical protein
VFDPQKHHKSVAHDSTPTRPLTPGSSTDTRTSPGWTSSAVPDSNLVGDLPASLNLRHDFAVRTLLGSYREGAA